MRAPLRLALLAMILLGACGCRVLQDREGPRAYVGDASINARVEIALAQSPSVAAQEIDVHTYQGTVTLDGVVDSAAMARRAEQIARATAGVKTVDSRLQVAAGTARPSGVQGSGDAVREALRE